MSSYAFEDTERKIYAKQATKNHIDKLYYCPSPFCKAHLYLCSVDGLASPYFRATKKDFPHSDNCFYRRNIDFDAGSMREEEFNFDDIINSLLTVTNRKSSTNKEKGYSEGSSEYKVERIRTLRQLYLEV